MCNKKLKKLAMIFRVKLRTRQENKFEKWNLKKYTYN